MAGVAALVAVALGVGLIGGIAMFVGANVVGFGGGASGETTDRATDPGAGATLYAPAPVPTKTATGPAITLHASPTSASEKKRASKPDSPSAEASKSPAAKKTTAEKASEEKKITLQVGTVSAEPMEPIYLTGIYPEGEGAVLRLERREGGRWQEFGISDVRVTGEQFSTTIQTGRLGRHKFRVTDVDSGAHSNKVSVVIE